MVTFRITLEQMQEKHRALTGMLRTHQVELAQKSNTGPTAAQAARMVALALVEQAHSLLDQVNSSIEYMLELENADTLAATIEPLCFESSAILLLVLRKIVRMVNEKITQANSITARAEWQTIWEKFNASYEGEKTIQCGAEVSSMVDGLVATNTYSGLRTVLCPQCGKPVDLDRNGQIYPHNETQSVQPRPQKV